MVINDPKSSNMLQNCQQWPKTVNYSLKLSNMIYIFKHRPKQPSMPNLLKKYPKTLKCICSKMVKNGPKHWKIGSQATLVREVAGRPEARTHARTHTHTQSPPPIHAHPQTNTLAHTHTHVHTHILTHNTQIHAMCNWKKKWTIARSQWSQWSIQAFISKVAPCLVYEY